MQLFKKTINFCFLRNLSTRRQHSTRKHLTRLQREMPAVQWDCRLFWSGPIFCRGGWAVIGDAFGGGDEGGMWSQEELLGAQELLAESKVGQSHGKHDPRVLHPGARVVLLCAGRRSPPRREHVRSEEAAQGWGATKFGGVGGVEAQRRTEWTDVRKSAWSGDNPAEQHPFCEWLIQASPHTVYYVKTWNSAEVRQSLFVGFCWICVCGHWAHGAAHNVHTVNNFSTLQRHPQPLRSLRCPEETRETPLQCMTCKEDKQLVDCNW